MEAFEKRIPLKSLLLKDKRVNWRPIHSFVFKSFANIQSVFICVNLRPIMFFSFKKLCSASRSSRFFP